MSKQLSHFACWIWWRIICLSPCPLGKEALEVIKKYICPGQDVIWALFLGCYGNFPSLFFTLTESVGKKLPYTGYHDIHVDQCLNQQPSGLEVDNSKTWSLFAPCKMPAWNFNIKYMNLLCSSYSLFSASLLPFCFRNAYSKGQRKTGYFTV